MTSPRSENSPELEGWSKQWMKASPDKSNILAFTQSYFLGGRLPFKRGNMVAKYPKNHFTVLLLLFTDFKNGGRSHLIVPFN